MKLVWDKTGERLYETGIKHGVLYIADETGKYKSGVAWNGLVGVSENPTGAEPTAIYADDMKYLNITSTEEFEGTIEAFTYPNEFKLCHGEASLGGADTGVTIGQQARRIFAMSYRTTIGNDVLNNDYGYKIHIVYGCLISPSEMSYQTINDSPEAITMSWDFKSTPLPISDPNNPKAKPTATVVIDSTLVSPEKMKLFEEALYGTDTEEAKLLLPEDILEILAA